MSETAHSELISFLVGEQEFCIDIMAVREIRGWAASTPLPHAPDWVLGVINLRGAVLPVIDLAARLGQAAATPTGTHVVIVVRIRETLVGLLADAVCDILSVTDDMVQHPPRLGRDDHAGIVTGVIPMEGKMITLLDLDGVLPDEAALAA